MTMDCRKWLFSTVLMAAAGCAHDAGGPLITTENQAMAEATPEKELPKRSPRAHTCVVLGNLKEKEAESSTTLREQELLRDQARLLYQQALEIDPDNLEALHAFAKMYVAVKDHDRALAAFQRALKTYPRQAVVWFDLGMYHSQCKEWDQAVQCLRQAVACEPENRYYANNLGFCLARAGQLDESLACFEQTAGPAKAHYNLARMLLHMNQMELGKDHLRQAVAADPGLEDARRMLAQVDAKKATLNIEAPDALMQEPDKLPASGTRGAGLLTVESIEGSN
jgi:tetratricopeptide (TPR) repeat protein